MLNVEKALKEITSKTHLEIEEDAAWSWASRSSAAYHMVSTGNLSQQDSLRMLLQAEDYFGEALEHAAKYEDMGALVHQVQVAVKTFQDAAIATINAHMKRVP